MDIYNVEYDERSECYLVLATMTLKEYKEFVEDAFNNNGNIAGQRDVIGRSAVASKIRTRMSDDFKKGAVFPQVVIGLFVENSTFNIFKKFNRKGKNQEIIDFILSIDKSCVSIIDGIQRTNIYFENYEGREKRRIRVEFYVTTEMIKLLYRMLVLNTGQVPWNTRRQLEVIFSHLSKSVIDSVKEKEPELAEKITINSIDDKKRRRQSGILNKSTLIEMYLSFNTRNVKVDLSNEIAEEFQRFDMLESVEKKENFDWFIKTFILFAQFDIALGDYKIEANPSDESEKQDQSIKSGKDFFTNIPIVIGFIVACAEYTLGAVTANRTDKTKEIKFDKIKSYVNYIIQKLSTDDGSFMDFDTLNLAISSVSKRGNIGENQRKFFKDLFINIFQYEDLEELTSLSSFWRE